MRQCRTMPGWAPGHAHQPLGHLLRAAIISTPSERLFPYNINILEQQAWFLRAASHPTFRSPGAPALAGKSDWYLMNQQHLFRSGYRGSHPDDAAGAQMRAIAQSLDVNSSVKDVVAYIRTIGETEAD